MSYYDFNYIINTSEDGWIVTGLTDPTYAGDIVIPGIHDDEIENGYGELPIKEISTEAFKDCIALTSIYISENIKLIGSRAFDNCRKITNVTIPNSIESIGEYAFNACSRLNRVNIDDVSAWCQIIFANSSANPLYHANTLYVDNIPVVDINIPDNITVLNNYVFNNCRNIVRVIFGENSQLTTIGEGAFSGCIGLIDINIPNTVTTIGSNAFYHCSELLSVTIPSNLSVISNYAFYYCTNLSNPALPSSITTVGDYAFAYCNNIIDLIIDGNINTIGAGAFRSCINLKSLEVQGGPQVISADTFKGCTSLESVNLFSGITTIQTGAFAGCTALQFINIPTSVGVIGDYAFDNCTSLLYVYYSGSVEDWVDIIIGTFNEYLTGATIYYAIYHITINTVNASSNKVSATISVLNYEALFYPESNYYIDNGSVSGSMGVEDIVDYIIPEGNYLKLYIPRSTGNVVITVTGKKRPQSAFVRPYINNVTGYTNLLGDLRVL